MCRRLASPTDIAMRERRPGARSRITTRARGPRPLRLRLKEELSSLPVQEEAAENGPVVTVHPLIGGMLESEQTLVKPERPGEAYRFPDGPPFSVNHPSAHKPARDKDENRGVSQEDENMPSRVLHPAVHNHAAGELDGMGEGKHPGNILHPGRQVGEGKKRPGEKEHRHDDDGKVKAEKGVVRRQRCRDEVPTSRTSDPPKRRWETRPTPKKRRRGRSW